MWGGGVLEGSRNSSDILQYNPASMAKISVFGLCITCCNVR